MEENNKNKVLNVPNLRFSDDLWRSSKIGDVLTIERGGSPRPIQNFITKSKDGVNWIKIGDTSDDGYIYSAEEKIIPEGVKHSRKVNAGDLLLSNSMSFGKPYILKIDGCIHDGWLVIKDKTNMFNKEFLKNYLGSSFCISQYKKLAAGGVVTNLNKELVGGAIIKFPSRSAQDKIASFLCTLDERIRTQNKIIEKIKSLIKPLFEHLNKDANREIRLSEIGEYYSADSISWDEITNFGDPVILYGQLFTKYEYVINSIDSKTEKRLSTRTSANDLLFPTSTTVDALSLISPAATNIPNVMIGGDMFGIRLNANFDCVYISFLINCLYKKQLSKYAQGSTIIHLHYDDIKNYQLLTCDAEQQHKISKIMILLTKKMRIEQEVLKEYQQQKQFLLNNLFI